MANDQRSRLVADLYGVRPSGIRIDGRVIVDKTWLKGLYDFTLRYSMQPGPNDDTPSIFAAVEEQLGLRLVPDRAPLTVVTVDYIERPTPD